MCFVDSFRRDHRSTVAIRSYRIQWHGRLVWRAGASCTLSGPFTVLSAEGGIRQDVYVG